jgi:SEC-C motif domain protein
VIAGHRPAATAEELMRSRYTAHVINDERYLHLTFQGTAHRPFVASGEAPPTKWTRLVIHRHEPGAKPDTATVEFSAYYEDQGVVGVLEEKAEFQRTNGAWIYTRALRQGPAPVRAAGPKVGRNDPCPCGSGKKHKHCCLRAA